MSVLLITYDLNKSDSEVYNELYKVIDSYNGVKLSESSYAFKTNKTPEIILKELESNLTDRDTLYIIPLSEPGISHLPKQIFKRLDDLDFRTLFQ